MFVFLCIGIFKSLLNLAILGIPAGIPTGVPFNQSSIQSPPLNHRQKSSQDYPVDIGITIIDQVSYQLPDQEASQEPIGSEMSVLPQVSHLSTHRPGNCVETEEHIFGK
jgi:hypothetical protein